MLLCTTKLAQSTTQYYFVLQSLHEARPSTTLTTKLAQSTSLHYLVLQSLHKHVPALLSTTKFAHSNSQYYFVLLSLHKVLPSTTLYCKACTKHVPVLLCTTKLAQSTTQYYFVLQSLHKARPSDKSLSQPWCRHSNIYDVQLQKRIVLRCGPFTKQPWRSQYDAISCDIEKLNCKTHENYAHRCEKLQLQNRLSAPKPKNHDFEALFKRTFKRKITSAKMKKICWQITTVSQPWCSHSNTIFNVQLQKTIVLRMHPRQQATLTHSLHCDLSPQMQQAHRTTHTWKTTRCRTPRENQFDDEVRSQPQPPHTQGTLHRRLQPLYKEKHKVSCSGFLPKTNPMQ